MARGVLSRMSEAKWFFQQSEAVEKFPGQNTAAEVDAKYFTKVRAEEIVREPGCKCGRYF